MVPIAACPCTGASTPNAGHIRCFLRFSTCRSLCFLRGRATWSAATTMECAPVSASHSEGAAELATGAVKAPRGSSAAHTATQPCSQERALSAAPESRSPKPTMLLASIPTKAAGRLAQVRWKRLRALCFLTTKQVSPWAIRVRHLAPDGKAVACSRPFDGLSKMELYHPRLLMSEMLTFFPPNVKCRPL